MNFCQHVNSQSTFNILVVKLFFFFSTSLEFPFMQIKLNFKIKLAVIVRKMKSSLKNMMNHV